MKKLTLLTFVSFAVLISAFADAYTVTKCTNGMGDVIIVNGHTCPSGWYPTY